MHSPFCALLLLAALGVFLSLAGAVDNDGLIPVTGRALSERDVGRFKSGNAIRGSLDKDSSRTVWFGAEKRNGRFPDVDISLKVLNRHGDADIYCTPLPLVETVSRQPGPSLYAWKSIYSQDTDELFLSSRSKPFIAGEMNVTRNGVEDSIVAFGCSILGVSWEATSFEFGVGLSYSERVLVDEEKAVISNLYDQCCKGFGECIRWRMNATDSDEDNSVTENGEMVEFDFCHRPGSLCTQEGRLKKLDMRNYHLNCDLPVDELAKLKELQKIDLDDNLVKGTVGEIVGKLGSLPNMQRISIMNNELDGELDDFEKYCHIFRPGRLTYLDLAYNMISGSLADCMFSKEDNFGKTASGLLELRLSNNLLTGVIPNTFSDESALELLDLDYNVLSGTLPESLGTTKYIRTLRFTGNQLEGDIPDTIGNIPSLLLLSGTDNKFTALPVSWTDPRWQPPKQLKLVDFSDNQLAGSFPVGLGNSDELLGLQLGGNVLSGPLTWEEGLFYPMLALNISSNSFTGAIPDALGKISVFSPAEDDPAPLVKPTFDLRFNQFSGELPSFFYPDEASGIMDPIVYLAGNDAITCTRPQEARHTGISCSPSSIPPVDTPAVTTPIEVGEPDESMFAPDPPASVPTSTPSNDHQESVPEPPSNQFQAIPPHEQPYPSQNDRMEGRAFVQTQDPPQSKKMGFNTTSGVLAAVASFLVLIGVMYAVKRRRAPGCCTKADRSPPEDVMGYAMMEQSPSRNIQVEPLIEETAQRSSEV